MPRSSRRPARVLAAALVTAAVAACSGDGGARGLGAGESEDGRNEASDIGITEDTITLGGHFPLSGAAAAGVGEIPLGITAYLGHVNDEGGVHGRSIEYRYEDDGDDPARAVEVVRELVLDDDVFALVGRAGTPTHGAVLEFLNDEGVPDLFVTSGAPRWGEDPGAHPFTFGWQPDATTEGEVIGRFVADELPDAPVGLLLPDDEVGTAGEAGIRAHVDDARIVAVQRHPAGDAAVGPQLAALAAAGADVVVSFTPPTDTALARQRAAELGFAPQWIHSTAGSDPALVGPLEGALTTAFLPTVDDPDDAWIRLFRSVWDAQVGEGELTDRAVHGMSLAYTAVQALQAAGRNPTREGLVEALEQAGADFEGPVLAPFRWSADSHLGAAGVELRRVVGGVLELVRPVAGARIGPPPGGIPDEQFYE